MNKNRTSGAIPKNKNGIRLLDNIGKLPRLNGDRLDVFVKTKGNCFYCGRKLTTKGIDKDNYFTIDHIIPLSKNGPDVIENKVPSCRECNQKKRDLVYTDKILEKLEEILMEFNVMIEGRSSGENHPNTKISNAISLIMDAMADGKRVVVNPVNVIEKVNNEMSSNPY